MCYSDCSFSLYTDIQLYTGRWQKSKNASAKKKQTSNGMGVQNNDEDSTVAIEALNRHGKPAKKTANTVITCV